MGLLGAIPASETSRSVAIPRRDLFIVDRLSREPIVNACIAELRIGLMNAHLLVEPELDNSDDLLSACRALMDRCAASILVFGFCILVIRPNQPISSISVLDPTTVDVRILDDRTTGTRRYAIQNIAPSISANGAQTAAFNAPIPHAYVFEGDPRNAPSVLGELRSHVVATREMLNLWASMSDAQSDEFRRMSRPVAYAISNPGVVDQNASLLATSYSAYAQPDVPAPNGSPAASTQGSESAPSVLHVPEEAPRGSTVMCMLPREVSSAPIFAPANGVRDPHLWFDLIVQHVRMAFGLRVQSLAATRTHQSTRTTFRPPEFPNALAAVMRDLVQSVLQVVTGSDEGITVSLTNTLTLEEIVTVAGLGLLEGRRLRSAVAAALGADNVHFGLAALRRRGESATQSSGPARARSPARRAEKTRGRKSPGPDSGENNSASADRPASVSAAEGRARDS